MKYYYGVTKLCSNFDTLLRNVNKLNKLLDNAKRKRYAKTEFKG